MTTHMINSPPKHSNRILEALRAGPTVRVVGYAYLVDLGHGVQPRAHTVHKDKTCACGDPACLAVAIVADWLKAGRIERAPDPRPGFMPYLPKACPVCGAPVFADHSLSNGRRGIGWQCTRGGQSHYWQTQWEAVRGWFFRDPLLPGLPRRDLVDAAPMNYQPAANSYPTKGKEG